MKATLIIIAFALSSSGYCQTTNDLSAIFKESYAFEADSNYIKATAALQEVYDENSYEINIRLGWLNYLKTDYPSSNKYYSTAIELLPYAIEPKLGYVLPLSALGNWDEVINTYNQILTIDPQNTLVNYRLGAIYYYRGNYEEAYLLVEKVVNLYPFDYDSVILFAWINLQRGDFRKAEVLFNKSLLIRPEDESAIEGLALIK